MPRPASSKPDPIPRDFPGTTARVVPCFRFARAEPRSVSDTNSIIRIPWQHAGGYTSIPEIAEYLGITRQRVHRARERLGIDGRRRLQGPRRGAWEVCVSHAEARRIVAELGYAVRRRPSVADVLRDSGP